MATRSAKIDQKADLIWAIADKLTGVYKPHEYGDVILPLTVIRRFDCILSDTKDAVLQKYDEVKNLPMKDILLRKASKKDFYNTSKYTFERLMDDPDHIEENFREYLNKFSANVRDILEKFKFDGHITTMANKGILYIVLKEYTTDRGNLHPNEISNLEMGYIFEEIIRRFSESHNEDAGQHYTPREVIQLMVNILFYDDNDILSGNNVAKTIYDPACGTGGMLSVAEEYLHSLNTYPDFKKRINGADRKSDGCRIRSSYAVGFTKDAGDNSKVVMRKENIRNAFNSPMRPFVLATTSIGQEGLDFHNYCRVIMHWNLPSNPIDVGRILRTFKIKKNVEVTDNGKIII